MGQCLLKYFYCFDYSATKFYGPTEILKTKHLFCFISALFSPQSNFLEESLISIGFCIKISGTFLSLNQFVQNLVVTDNKIVKQCRKVMLNIFNGHFFIFISWQLVMKKNYKELPKSLQNLNSFTNLSSFPCLTRYISCISLKSFY